MPRARLETLAAAGLRATNSVSVKTARVVTAPCSQSGKARRCRDLGIRVVTEQVLLHLLDQIPPGAGSTAARGPEVAFGAGPAGPLNGISSRER
jgi:hypothetical protein